MPQAYSDDLRCRFLRAYERNNIGLEDLAEQFEVSYGYAKKVRRQQLHFGQMERVPQSQHGPVSRVDTAVEEQLRAEVRRQPDATLAELRQRLEANANVRLSKTRLWEVLGQLGLRRKKNHSTRPSRTAKRGDSGGKPGGSR